MIEEKAGETGVAYDLDGRRHRCSADDIPDADLAEMDRIELLGAALAMRRAIRAHRDAAFVQGRATRVHRDLELWDLLPDAAVTSK